MISSSMITWRKSRWRFWHVRAPKTRALALRLMVIRRANLGKQRPPKLMSMPGANFEACATALREEIARQGLALRVATVTGDDLMDQLETIAASTPFDMFTRARFPDPATVGSVNAYLGGFPVAAALESGADIVITGRCVDSAVTLGACIHTFGWTADSLNQLAAASLAGHIIECGTQATGGNFTDWHRRGQL